MLRMTRLRKELEMLESDAPDYILLRMDEDDTLLWSYLIEGPPGTPYEGGWYWGVLKLPENYPFSPPSILMMTPNGRFVTNTRLCLSMSDFHPESWQPAWWLSSLMKGLLSFMLDSELTTGAVMPAPPDEEKRRLAGQSLEWTRARPEFLKAFPDIDSIVEAARARRPPPELPAQEAAEAGPEEAAAAAGAAEAAPRLADEAAPLEAPATELGRSGAQSGGGGAGASLEAEAQAPATSGGQAPAAVKAVDDDPRPLAVGDTVRVKVEGLDAMAPEERQYAGREGIVKKGARPGCVRVFLARQGDAGVNIYFRHEQLERIRRIGGATSGKAR